MIQPHNARYVAELLWLLLSTHHAYLAFKLPEDKAEILNQLMDRVDEEMNKLTPDQGRAD